MCVGHHAHDLCLVCDLSQDSPNLLVTINKSELGILQTSFFGELFHEYARRAEIVSRKAREEMVRHLEVQTAVEEREV